MSAAWNKSHDDTLGDIGERIVEVLQGRVLRRDLSVRRQLGVRVRFGHGTQTKGRQDKQRGSQ